MPKFSALVAKLKLAILVSILMVCGCSEQTAPERIYLNGDIVTIDQNNPGVEALATRGELIIALGSEAELRALAGPDTEFVDLRGRALLPGFIAAHEHPAINAVFRNFIDMSGFTHPDAASAWQSLREALADAPEGEWIYAMGLDPVLLADLQTPTRDFLDEMAPQNPLFILAQSMHTAWVNSAALAEFSIDENSPAPGEGSYYGRDQHGKLNGMLVEKQALEPFLEPHKNLLKIAPAYTQVLDDLRANGYTSVASLGFNLPGWLARWASSRNLKPRIRQFFYYRGENLAKLAGSPKSDSDYFRVLGGKFWYDGSPYSGSMLLDQPYLASPLAQQLGIEHGSHGKPVVQKDELEAALRGLHSRGWQTAVHIQGDRAGRDFLQVLTSLQQSLPRAQQSAFAQRRHRLEHGLLLDTSLLPAMHKLGVTPSFHINHLYYYGDALQKELLGPQRSDRLLPVRSAFELSMRPTLHADSPMFPADPFSLMQTAITRRSRSGNVIGIAEAISPQQALRAMTINGAWQLGMEHKLGSLEAGKLADMVILERNPLKTPLDQWRDIKVEQSILAGR